MSKQQRGRTSSQDFAFQSTDQPFAHPFGGADGAAAPRHQHVFAPQPHHRHEAQPATDGSIAPSTPTQGSALDASLRFPDSGAPQGPAPHPGAPAPFSADYGFSPGAGRMRSTLPNTRRITNRKASLCKSSRPSGRQTTTLAYHSQSRPPTRLTSLRRNPRPCSLPCFRIPYRRLRNPPSDFRCKRA
jgi:hypothetical protein